MGLCKYDLSKKCEGKYRDCVDCVLDKIRAEILEEKECPSCFDDDNMFAYTKGLDNAIYIIDKYKAESEANR